MRRTLAVPLLTLAACAMPSAAAAGTASHSGGVFTFDAAPGEGNYLTLDVVDDCGDLGITPCLSVSETPSYPLTPPVGCVHDGFTSILCPVPSSVVLNTGDGEDIVKDWEGPSRIDAGTEGDTVFGRGGDDQLLGGLGADVLVGGAGNDVVEGGQDRDLLEDQISNYGVILPVSPNDSAGTDRLRGGEGYDTVSYQSRTDGLAFSLDSQANDGAPGEGDDVATDVEQVNGGLANDAFTGNAAPNAFAGHKGNDTLDGRDGDDSLDGGPGDDVVRGEAGADTVAGGHDQDLVDGGVGRDNLYGEYEIGCSNLEPCIGGGDKILARDGERDTVSCGVGTDVAEADTVDFIRDIPGATECERVDAVAAGGGGSGGGAGGGGGAVGGGGGAVEPPKPSASARIQADVVTRIRRCRSLRRSAQVKSCVRRTIKRANARCKRLRPASVRKSCLRGVKRAGRKS